jgi:membrane-bound lytic murein transglycosylase D
LHIDGDRVGIWQLTYLNARRFGLRVDESIDERYDVRKSTEAAIKYLQFLEALYPKNPLFVVTAFYNSVPYVSKIIKSIPEGDEKAFYTVLNKDTKDFLLHLSTWNEWQHHFKTQKKNDVIAKEQKNWKGITVKDSIAIKVLAEFLGMEVGLMRIMNPTWVGTYLTSESENHPFYLTKDKASFINSHYDELLNFEKEKLEKEKKELAEFKKRMENDVPDPKKYRAVTYKVRSGDVLGLIAQRYNVKVSSIKKWNKLSSDRINIGQELVLYVSKSKKVDLPEEKVGNKIDLVKKEPKAGKGSYTTYVVKDGESLWIIARKFPGVSSENIMEWNGVSDKIKPGQKLKIYKGE